jgi:hypothetical protein
MQRFDAASHDLRKPGPLRDVDGRDARSCELPGGSTGGEYLDIERRQCAREGIEPALVRDGK